MSTNDFDDDYSTEDGYGNEINNDQDDGGGGGAGGAHGRDGYAMMFIMTVSWW